MATDIQIGINPTVNLRFWCLGMHMRIIIVNYYSRNFTFCAATIADVCQDCIRLGLVAMCGS